MAAASTEALVEEADVPISVTADVETSEPLGSGLRND
jgi:hypothetical protein